MNVVGDFARTENVNLASRGQLILVAEQNVALASGGGGLHALAAEWTNVERQHGG
jgi:hypothetical protein